MIALLLQAPIDKAHPPCDQQSRGASPLTVGGLTNGSLEEAPPDQVATDQLPVQHRHLSNPSDLPIAAYYCFPLLLWKVPVASTVVLDAYCAILLDLSQLKGAQRWYYHQSASSECRSFQIWHHSGGYDCRSKREVTTSFNFFVLWQI